MESMLASASIALSPSRRLAFSPRRRFHAKRQFLLPISKKQEDEADFHRDPSSNSIVPFYNNPAAPASFSKDAAMGLILSAAAGRGWTTGSGMEGPPAPADSKAAEQPSLRTFPWSLYTKSPRRRMRVAFTCNVCGQRTTRAINPHAYTDGTVFVQCCGCNVFHKLVDNLKLFHEMKCYVNPSFRYNEEMPFNYLDEDDDQNIFPIL